MSDQIVQIKQLPVIEQRLEMVKPQLEEKVEKILMLECTSETVKTVKETRAELNREFKEWEEKRIKVKKCIMEPYDHFEQAYRKYVKEVYSSADFELKNKIDAVENTIKCQKTNEIERYFCEYSKSKGIDFLKFSDARINVTISASLKSLKEKIKDYIDQVASDVEFIKTLENSAEIYVEYRNCFDITKAIGAVKERHKAITEIQDQSDLYAEATEEKIEQLIKEDDPILVLNFKVTAPKSKLKNLKNFLITGGYIYE